MLRRLAPCPSVVESLNARALASSPANDDTPRWSPAGRVLA